MLCACRATLRFRSSAILTGSPPPSGLVSDLAISDGLTAILTAHDFDSAEHAAFIRSTQSLAMWTDHADQLLGQIESMQDSMMSYLWRGVGSTEVAAEPRTLEEGEEPTFTPRPTFHQAPIQVGLAVGLNVFVNLNFASTFSSSRVSTPLDTYAMRIGRATFDWFSGRRQRHGTHSNCRSALHLHDCPILLCKSLYGTRTCTDTKLISVYIDFLAQSSLMGVIFQLVGPVAHLQRNTKYYSGVRPERMAGELPHIVRHSRPPGASTSSANPSVFPCGLPPTDNPDARLQRVA